MRAREINSLFALSFLAQDIESFCSNGAPISKNKGDGTSPKLSISKQGSSSCPEPLPVTFPLAPEESCAGQCGGHQKNCFCDAECHKNCDCCADVDLSCPHLFEATPGALHTSFTTDLRAFAHAVMPSTRAYYSPKTMVPTVVQQAPAFLYSTRPTSFRPREAIQTCLGRCGVHGLEHGYTCSCDPRTCVWTNTCCADLVPVCGNPPGTNDGTHF